MTRGQQVEIYRRRIRAVYAATSAARRDEGRHWYEGARREVRRLARRYGLPLRPVAAVVAAISPGNRWATNMEQAEKVIKAAVEDRECPTVSTYNQGWAGRAYGLVKLALDVKSIGPGVRVAGAWWEWRIGELRVVSGPKRSAFYRLLRDGGNDQDVCVDGHAAAMCWTASAADRPTSNSVDFHRRASGVKEVTPYQYAMISDAFRAEAAELRLQPCQLQAITWLEWRER